MLAAIRRPDGGELDLTLTTNGSALRALAGPLGRRRACGGSRSASTRSTTPSFGRDERDRLPGRAVLDGIDAAIEAGLAPVKINMVVRRGDQRDEHRADGALGARDAGVILRFIEYMDVGHSNGWRLDEVVPAEEIVATHRRRVWPVEPVAADLPRRGRRPLALRRWRRRVRGHLVGHPAVLRRLHARADLGRGQALHLPVRASTATTCGRCSARARPTPT